jgi:hypothetical protein
MPREHTRHSPWVEILSVEDSPGDAGVANKAGRRDPLCERFAERCAEVRLRPCCLFRGSLACQRSRKQGWRTAAVVRPYPGSSHQR